VARYEEHIARTPGVQGGYPVIRGTRTPVRTVVALYQTHSENRDAVREALPHLTDEQIDAALAYYQDHPAIVDEDIARQKAALDTFLARR
jgi:uncharacterized protein (DUF433 family)